ncbi:MAG: hypothetical protein IPJ19_09770 [Planctomycetes bacterium]|nr:hypothetical protein [Planctomycetota bacterium]
MEIRAMKLLPIGAALVLLLAPSRADVMTPATTLRVTFRVEPPFLPSPPDTLMLLLDHPFIQTPIGSYTATLFDGTTLVGTHTSTLLGLAQGQMFLHDMACWKSAGSLFTVDNPTVIDFTPILNGSIDGVIEFTIATGEIDFALDKVVVQLSHASSSGSGVHVDPQPFITSIRLGAFENFCFGDGGLATACPCSNSGMPERGCQNSWLTGGAQLVASGSTSPDTIHLTSIKEPPFVLSVFLQGNALVQGGVPFGDGVRCVGGSLRRLYVKFASNNLGADGDATAPATGDLSISAQSAALGDAIPSGATRYYQVYYRDPTLSFCPSPTGNSWNVSSAVAITW